MRLLQRPSNAWTTASVAATSGRPHVVEPANEGVTHQTTLCPAMTHFSIGSAMNASKDGARFTMREYTACGSCEGSFSDKPARRLAIGMSNVWLHRCGTTAQKETTHESRDPLVRNLRERHRPRRSL